MTGEGHEILPFQVIFIFKQVKIIFSKTTKPRINAGLCRIVKLYNYLKISSSF